MQVREIQQELGITTVYVTHDQAEALAVSDRVAVVNDGRIEQVGTPRDIYRRPASRFVAEFVGDNNVFSGEVTGVRDGGTGPVADVAVAGHSLTVAVEGRAVAAGDSVTFCVRPERLALGDGTTTLPATVASREFLGETTRVHLSWAGGQLSTRATEPPGGEVTVGFEPADAHVVCHER